MKRKLLRLLTTAAPAALLLFAAGQAGATAGGTPQASITLNNYGNAICISQNHVWTLDKSGGYHAYNDAVPQQGYVTWAVSATKDPAGDPAKIINVFGYLTITNTGSANATVGNIVINLQRPAAKNKQNVPWVSAAADVADATNGDNASTANIVAAASAENATVNQAQGPHNYTVSGAAGTFVETAASGALEFTNASNDTLFSLSPQLSLAPGASITLKYSAKFNNDVLNLAPGSLIRSEALVSFGNAGGRGGSGASATNVDINGTPGIQPDEANVRTVPSRVTTALPTTVEQCNDSVTVTDPGVASITGVVTADTANMVNPLSGGVTISSSSAWALQVNVDGHDTGGQVCNDAFLNGTSDAVTITDPISGAVLFSFPCCVAAYAEAGSCVPVPGSGGGTTVTGFQPGDFCTNAQEHWGNKKDVNAGLATYFASHPGTIFEVGVSGASGYSLQFNSAAAVAQFLGSPGGPNGPLDTDLGPTPAFTSSSSGAFGGQVLALKLNVVLNYAGILKGNSPVFFGDLLVTNTGTSFDNQTVANALSQAQLALGTPGGYLPAGFSSYNDINGLIQKLNDAFDLCKVKGYAQTLFKLP